MASQILHSSSVGKNARKPPLIHVILGLLLIVGIAAGCSSGGESALKGSAAPAPLQACELLTKAEAEAILEGAVDEPNRNSTEGEDWMSSCNYYSPQGERGVGLLIQRSPSADPVKELERHTASLTKSLGDAHKPQPVDGIGGAAVWDGSAKQLTIFQGAYKLIVTASGTQTEEGAALEVAKTATEKVLSKLPQ